MAGLSRERVRAELLKLLVAPRAAEVFAEMAGGGLLLPVLGVVPMLSRFRAVAGLSAGDPAFRLAALALSTQEDALRLRERLKLSNAEFDRIARLAQALEALAGRQPQPGLAQLRHLAHRAGTDAVSGALALLSASAGREQAQDMVAALEQTPPFLLRGRDLLEAGIQAGPSVGVTLERLRHEWVEAGCAEGKAAQLALLQRASPYKPSS